MSEIYDNVNKPCPQVVTLGVGWFTAINSGKLYYYNSFLLPAHRIGKQLLKDAGQEYDKLVYTGPKIYYMILNQ